MTTSTEKHQRHLIRHALTDRLRNRTVAEERVEATRMVPWRAKDLPGIAVYALVEPVDPESASTAPRELTRYLRLAVELAIQAGTVSQTDVRIDDALDAGALEIEKVIAEDDTLGGTVGDIILENTEIDIPEPRGEQLIGIVRLTYRATYRTLAHGAADNLDVLATVDTHYDLAAQQEDANQAEDLITGLDT